MIVEETLQLQSRNNLLCQPIKIKKYSNLIVVIKKWQACYIKSLESQNSSNIIVVNKKELLCQPTKIIKCSNMTVVIKKIACYVHQPIRTTKSFDIIIVNKKKIIISTRHNQKTLWHDSCDPKPIMPNIKFFIVEAKNPLTK
jgi:hypothetical protein